MVLQPEISVNGVVVTPHDIEDTTLKDDVVQKIVTRELLIQRAVDLKLCDRKSFLEDDDEILAVLLKREVKISDPDMGDCLTYYKKNIASFMTSPQFDAAHILFPVQPSDIEKRMEAHKDAEKALNAIFGDPDLFEEIKRYDDKLLVETCGKANDSPAILAALSNMSEGEVSTTPILSEFGYHLLKLYKIIEGDALPFKIVEGWISEHIKNQDWQKAFVAYIKKLANNAEIKGVNMSDLKASYP